MHGNHLVIAVLSTLPTINDPNIRKTEWVWVAVGLVLFGILMAGLVLFCRGRFRRRTPGLLEDMDVVDDEPQMAMTGNKQHFEVINGYENEY